MMTAAPTSVCQPGTTDQNKQVDQDHPGKPEYSSGATLAAGACLNASVMPHWPTRTGEGDAAR